MTKKIKNLNDLEDFIQKKSDWVSQVTLYGYLKTRMGTKYVLHFDDEKFLGSINTAKWNIYSIALQDLTFYTLSYLKVIKNYQNKEKLYLERGIQHDYFAQHYFVTNKGTKQ